MDAASISLIISSLLRLTADFSEQAASGTITDDQINAMLTLLGHNADTWQAAVDAHKAKVAAG